MRSEMLFFKQAVDSLNRTLKHVAQYSPLLSDSTKRAIQSSQPQNSNYKQRFAPHELALSELSLFIEKKYTLDIPVYTVWGACEDVRVLEKFRSGEYKVEKLHIIDEANSRLLEVGGVKLRLLGLGGAVVMHKLFDNGEGRTTIAGGQGTMWTTLLQMGELVDTANRVYDPTETRVFVTHASPAREGLLNQLSVSLKADFSVSAGLHFRYGSSYNEFSVNPTLDHYRGKLAASKASFNDVWDTVKSEVEPAVQQNDTQQSLLDNALEIVSKMPSVANGGNPFGGPVPGQGAGGVVDESAFKNMWNFNLADAAFGYLVLEIEAGRIGTEMRAQGFNFAHRGTAGKQNMKQSVYSPSTGEAPGSVFQGNSNWGALTGPGQHRQSTAPPAQTSQQFNQPPQQNQQPRSHQPPVQPKQPTPVQQQTQPTQDKTPLASSRTGPSPGPARTPPVAQVKPATPQPPPQPQSHPQPQSQTQSTGTNSNGSAPHASDRAASAPEVRNGSSPNDKSTAPPAAKLVPAPVEKKPNTSLFIQNIETEEAVRDLFDEDRWNITKVEKYGKTNHVVHFSTHEEAVIAFDRQPADHKKNHGPPVSGQPRKPNVKWFDDRGRNNYQRDNQGGQGAGAWQASNRGGASTSQRGGYQSGASDSEGGRGRGGFAGHGRGRGRGVERGGRGGRGGGRGGFNNKTTGGEEGPTTAPSAPASTPSVPTAPAAATPSAV